MPTDPRPETEPLESAPEPAGPDGDARDPTAEVVADAFVDDLIVEKQNDALDALVARDRDLAGAVGPKATAVAAAAPAPVAAPEPKATKTAEWTAAVVIMLLIAAVCFALMSFFRG